MHWIMMHFLFSISLGLLSLDQVIQCIYFFISSNTISLLAQYTNQDYFLTFVQQLMGGMLQT